MPKDKKHIIVASCLFLFTALFAAQAVKAVETTIAFMADGGGTRTQMVEDMDQVLLQKLGGWNIDAFGWAGDIGYDSTDGLSSSVAFGVSAYGSSTAGQAGIPLFLAEGNHEAENASDVVSLRAMYNTYQGYSVPGINGPDGWNFSQMPNSFSSTTNYAYDVGDVRMIVLNQYAATSSDAVNTTGRIHEQVYSWLKGEIKKTKKQHIAVMAHEPAYPVPSQTSGNHIGDALDADPVNRDRFVNLLASYGHVNHFVGHTHISDLYEMRNNSPAEGDARTTTTTLDGGIWELDAGGFGDKAPGGGSNGTYPGIGYLHTNSANYGDYQIRFVQGTGSPQWATPTTETVRMSDLTRQILVNTWEGAGTGTSSNGLFDLSYYVDYTAEVGANPDWSANNSGRWWQSAFSTTTAGWTQGELGVGYRSDSTKPGWINTPIDPYGGLGTTTPQVHSIMQRVVFPATTTASYSNLSLHVDDDDGIMVWLNGTLVLNTTNASVTAPTTGSGAEYFDQSQTSSVNAWAGSTTTPMWTVYDISAYKGSLIDGQNTLAIWNVNAGATSTDLGVAVRLSMSGAVDALGPVISSIASSTPTPNTATVSWTTNETSTTQVEYGLTTSYGSYTTLDASLVTSHSANITGLATSTLYHYRVASKDASNNISSSTDYTFITPASTPSGPATSTLRQGVNGYSGATDTYLNGSSTASNFGATATILIDGAGPYANALLKWDLSSIPASATVSDVKIVYNVTNNSGANTYSIYRSLVPWVGSEANWASSTASTAWGTPGSLDNADDYSPTALGTLGTAATGLATSTLNASGRTLVQNWISGATPNYGFLVTRTTSADIDGLQFDSAEGATPANRPALVVVYTTPSGPDVTAPVISGIASSSTGTSATVSWTTNEVATSTFEYGLTTSYGSSTSTTTATTSHSVQLSGLTASTTYHFKITATDGSSNVSTSSDLTFLVPPPDVTAPVISSIASSTGGTSATITWTNSEPATTKVVYGTVTDTYTGVSTSSVSTTSPSHSLTGLATSTLYYFRVVATDSSSNISTSSEATFLTTASSGIAWEVYIDTGDIATTANKSTVANVMNFGAGDGSSTSTRKFSDGSLTGVTFNIAGATNEAGGPEIGSALEDNTSGTRATPLYASSTTDARTEFGTNVNVAAATTLTTAGGTMTFSFSGLDTNKQYTLVAYGSRGNYNNRWSRMTLSGVDTFTSNGSAGALATTSAVTNDSFVINTGGNYNNGYVAKWIDIDPATTTIVLKQTSITYNGAAAGTIYMNAFKLVEQGESVPDTTGPVISSIASSTNTATATITFTTNENATSTIEYGTTTAYGSTTASTTLTTSHSTTLSGLLASTTYNFKITAYDALFNVSTSSNLTFTTAPVDVTAPVPTSIASSTSEADATITWSTVEAATSKVVYGTVSDTYTASSTSASFVTSHSRPITGLSASTQYFFRVVVADAAGNIATSSESSFTTTAGEITSTAWWNASWNKRIKINFDNTTQAENLIDFPVRVRLDSSLITYADFLANGDDIRFVDANGTTVLAHEVDGWDTGTSSNLWVKVPKVNQSSSADYMYMYYNHPTASSTATTTGVWNSNYKGVWHLSQSPAAVGSSTLDSTSNAKHGSTSGAMTAGQSVSGTIGNSYNLTGNDFVDFGTLGAMASGRTVSMWIYGNSWTQTGTYANTLYAFNTAQPTGGNSDIVRITTAGVIGYYNGATLLTNASSVPLSTAEWHHVALVSSSTANASYIYQDGVQVATTSSWAPAVGATDVFYAGQEIDGAVPSDFFNGRQDEVRVENVAQSPRWISAQYKTQNNTFQVYGSVESGTDTTAPVISSIASSTSTSTATITWTTDENASSSIAYGPTTGYGTNATSTGTTSHSVSLTGLTASTTYHFRVFAMDATGNQATSSDVTFFTAPPGDGTAPTVSSVASSTGVTTATITWTTDENSTSVVNYGLTSGYGSASSSSSLVTSHSIGLTGLSAATTYHFQVVSVDAATNSTSSVDYTFTTSATPDVTAPTVSMTAPTGGAVVTGASVALTANASDNVAVAGVQFKVDTNTNIGVEDTTSTYGVTWDSTGIADGVHTLIAVARDTAGNYATSSTVSVTVDNTAPVRSAGAPSGSVASGTTTVQISLSTGEVASCKYSTSSGTAYGSMTAFTNTSSTTHTTAVTGLSDDNTYTYYVKCQDSQGNVNATDYSISFTVASDTTAPVISSIASTTGSTTASVTFTTNENAGVSVRYGLTTSYGSSTATSSEATSHTVNITGLAPLTLYHYQILAQDSVGNLATSTDRSFTTTADVTAPAFSAITANSGASTSTITWTTDELASSRVQYGLTTSYASSTAETDTSPRVISHSVLISDLASCAVYHYRVISTDGSGNQATSTDQEFTTGDCTGNASPGVNEEQQVATSTGGSLDLDQGGAGIGLDIPAGFATSSAVFQAIQLSTSLVIGEAGNPALGVEAVNNYMFRLNALSGNDVLINTFNASITVTVTYRDIDIGSFNEASLWIYRYDGSTWYPLDACVVDTVANTVTCTTTHFSDFTLGGIPSPVVTTTRGGGTGPTSGSSAGVIYAPVTVISTSTATSATVTPVFTRNLSLNIVHAEVILMQTVLNMDKDTRIAISGAGSPGKETNKFGSLTKVALIKFQKKYKLPTTGIADAVTRVKLNQLYRSTRQITTSVAPIKPNATVTGFNQNLKLNVTHAEVLALQKILNSDIATQIAVSGIGSPGRETSTFGPATRAAVIKFQIKYGIIKNAQDSFAGTVGPATRAKLNMLIK